MKQEQVYTSTHEIKPDVLCPDCGASWTAIEDSIKSGKYEISGELLLLENCESCREHFAYELSILKADKGLREAAHV
jgi:hypothetical protein